MGYSTKYTGAQIDAALEKGQKLRVVNNGWIRLESSTASPTNLGNLKNPGNYTTSFWTDGPDFGDSFITPINISITNINGNTYQFITAGQKVYVRQILSGENSYNDWSIDQSDGAINPGPTAPNVVVDGKTVWLDTSDSNAPILKLYINGEWKNIMPEGYMTTDIYDPQGKKTDIFKYIDDAISTISTGAIDEIDSHIDDTTIHVTASEKTKLNNSATKSEVNTAVSNLQSNLDNKINEEISSRLPNIEELKTSVDNLSSTVDAHVDNSGIHPSLEKQAVWNTKAAGDHTHHLDGRVVIDTAHITGEITSDLLPYDVKERVYVIGSEEELFAITKNPVHNGDTFCIESETGNTWYFVVADEYLGDSSIDETWSETSINSTNTSRYWTSICYGNGKYVAIAYNGESGNEQWAANSTFAYSTDAINWTEIDIDNSDMGTIWNSVCYGNGKFVAVAYNAYLAYSTDGINWTFDYDRNSGKDYLSVCYGDGKFVSSSSGDNFGVSTDGITWQDAVVSNYSYEWGSICYGNGKFVTVGYNSNKVAYSADGFNWVLKNISSTDREWDSVCYGKDKFVAVANNSKVFAYSYDGITWIEGAISSANRKWTSVCYGNKMFVAVARESNVFAYSADGITWIEGTISSANRDWESICYGKDKFVAVSLNSNNVASSTLKPHSDKAFKKFSTSNTNWSDVVNTPTTLAGYGITDAVTKEEYAAVEAEVTAISKSIPSEVDLSNTAAAHTLYTEAVNDLKVLDETVVAMDSTIAKLEAICQ